MATNAALALILQAKTDDFQSGLAKAQKQFQSFGDKLQSIGSSLTKTLSLPLAAIGAASVASAMKMESLKKGLIAVSGSADAAEKQLSRLKEVAKLPGLGLEEAVQGSINLQASGFSADQAEKSLKAFGNALATVGKGKADLDGVILALGQIASKGKISAEEINQIAERVPQIRGAMQQAFGTSNTEQLQKMGIDAQTFVATVTDELAKLPPVTGGMQNAFENLGDSVKTSLAGLGDTIATTFNLEGLFNSIADKIANVTEWFKSLSPETQKFAVIIGSVAAAIGPVITGIGFFSSKILPLMSTGLKALSGGLTAIISPWGLIAAAVAAAVILIVKNWDAIVAYFTTGDGAAVWNKLSQIISMVMDSIQTTISVAIETIKAIWDKIGPAITSIVSGAFKNLMKIIDYALGFILDIVDVFSNIFSGNWEGVWAAVQRIFMRSINMIIDVLEGFITTSMEIFNGLAKLLGLEGFDNAITKVHQFADSIKFVIPETQAAENSIASMTQNAAANLDNLTAKANTAAKAVGSVGSGSAMAAETVSPIQSIQPGAGALGQTAMPIPNMDAVGQQIEQLNAQVVAHQEIVDATNEKYKQLGEQIGASMQVSATSVKDFADQAGKNMLRFILQVVKGFAAQAIAGLIANAVSTMGPAGVAVAAAAPGLVNGLFDSLIPKFAKGGIATGPTYGLFGEAGTEAIIPLNRLPDLVGKMAGPQMQQVEVVGQISGDVIRISNSRSTTRLNRTL